MVYVSRQGLLESSLLLPSLEIYTAWEDSESKVWSSKADDLVCVSGLLQISSE